MKFIKSKTLICSLLLTILFMACQQEPPTLSALTTPLSARAQYERQIKQSKAIDKVDLSEWDSIGRLAFTQNVEIPTPYRQSGFFLKGRAEVLAFELPLKQGERIDIEIKTDSTDIQLFVDFFEQRKGGWYPIIKSKKGETNFAFEVPRSDTFLLRIQPEFHKNGNYKLKILKNPIYAFPVAGRGNEDVWSFWGAPRDGGKRKHKGIDVFARRGEPLIAIADGLVTDVSDQGLGGKQVWIRDTRNNNKLYYAHLHKQLVKEGQMVQRGDTIGLVGNTGNARTTAPHLHFGIYRAIGGAIDPLPYVKTYRNRFLNNTATLKWDILNKGITHTNANLRNKPTGKKSLIRPLKDGSPVELLGTSGRWYHVRTLDGTVGFIHYTSIKQLKATVLS